MSALLLSFTSPKKAVCFRFLFVLPVKSGQLMEFNIHEPDCHD